MRVLVTGGTSLIARATMERLISRGHAVTTMQRRPGNPPAGVIEALGDIANEVALNRAVVGQEAVIHVAAKVDLVGSWREFERVNVVGTRRVLTAARAAGVTRFVHVSSPSVAHGGGSLVGAGADAADPTITRGHYATTKAIAERAALAAAGPDFAVVAVRPHLVWGPGDTQLVGRIIDRARSGRLATVGSGEPWWTRPTLTMPPMRWLRHSIVPRLLPVERSSSRTVNRVRFGSCSNAYSSPLGWSCRARRCRERWHSLRDSQPKRSGLPSAAPTIHR